MQEYASMTQELIELRGEVESSLCVMGAQELRLNQSLKTSHVSYSSLLPTELLEIIIVETVRATAAADHNRPSSCKPTDSCLRSRPELVLASVSRHWRAVALGMPLLWTEIRLFLGQSLDLLDLYLTRSQGQLLDIRFTGTLYHMRSRSSPELEPDYLRILNVILSHIHICHRLEVNVDFPIPKLLEGIGHTKAPMLGELIVYYPPNIPNSKFPFFTEGLHSLKSAELGNFSSISPDMFLSGNCLTALTLSGQWGAGLSPENFSDLLSCLPSLTHLTLIGEPVDYARTRTSDHPVVEIPLLETLVLKPEEYISKIYLPTIFRTIHAPVLRELVLDFHNMSSTRELESLMDKLKHEAQPFPTVGHLTLRSRSMIHGGWLALAHAFSGITSLLVSRYIANQLMGFVSCTGRRDAFPKLRTLWFDDVQFEWTLLFQLLQIREAVGLPVREVKMKGFKGHVQSVLSNGPLGRLEASFAAHAAVLIGWT